jgi:hypothetical protein
MVSTMRKIAYQAEWISGGSRPLKMVDYAAGADSVGLYSYSCGAEGFSSTAIMIYVLLLAPLMSAVLL